ncbi:MAG: hypothetical protein M1294_13420, partial [Firmicutes bacterium]|nr:hypothetical protein [Bacillota bacterium]
WLYRLRRRGEARDWQTQRTGQQWLLDQLGPALDTWQHAKQSQQDGQQQWAAAWQVLQPRVAQTQTPVSCRCNADMG